MVKDKDKIRFFGQQRHSIIFKKYLQKKEFILYSESIRYVSIANKKKLPCFLNSPAPAELVYYVMTVDTSDLPKYKKPGN